MTRTGHLRQMAAYNAWMNARLYEASARLPQAEIGKPRGAFFGSLLGTLNHLVVADTIWLKRFAAHPAAWPALEPVRSMAMPAALDAVPFPVFAALADHRVMLDAVISAWAGAVTEADLEQPLRYTNMRGSTFERDFFALAMHFFNHQTHHRGQATTLLFQAGVDVGATDLLVLIPDAAQA